jgi:hypothetical protein
MFRSAVAAAVVLFVACPSATPQEPAPPKPRPEYFLAGRVVDRAGQGVAGAVVRVDFDRTAPAIPFFDSHWWPAPRSTRTGADGSFRIEELREGPWRVEAILKDGGGVEAGGVLENTGDLRLELPGPTGIAGTVQDDTGAALSDFTVTAERVLKDLGSWPLHAHALPRRFRSETGAFEVLGLVPGTYDLTFAGGGLPKKLLRGVAVAAGEVRRGLEFRFDPGATIGGRVVEAGSGKPVLGANVWLQSPNGSMRESPVLSRKDGSFRLPRVGPGAHTLVVNHADHPNLEREIAVERGTPLEGLVLELAPGAVLEGVAIGPDGKPFAGGRVRVREFSFWGRQAKIDDAGRFRIGPIRPGKLTVQAEARDATGGTLEAEVQAQGGTTTVVDFAKPREGRVFRVRALRGDREAPGVKVRMVFSMSQQSGSSSCSTGEDETFRITGFDGGQAMVMIEVPPETPEPGTFHSTLTITVDIPKGSEAPIEVRIPGGSLTGRVLCAADRQAVPGVVVTAASDTSRVQEGPLGPTSNAQARTDREGRFRIRDLAAGAYQVTAGGMTSKGLAPSTSWLTLAEDGTANVDLALGRAAAAVVEVLDARGQPLAGARVRLVQPRDGEPAHGYQEGTEGRTDAQGRARFEGLEAGSYRAIVEDVDSTGNDCRREALEGAVTTFPIRLRACTQVLVQPKDPLGQAVPREKFMAFFHDAQGDLMEPRWKASSGAAPEVHWVLDPGTYVLTLHAQGFREHSSTVTVGTVSPQQVTVTLERAEGGR